MKYIKLFIVSFCSVFLVGFAVWLGIIAFAFSALVLPVLAWWYENGGRRWWHNKGLKWVNKILSRRKKTSSNYKIIEADYEVVEVEKKE